MLLGSESSKILKAEGVLVGQIAKRLECEVVKNGLKWLLLLWVFLFITQRLKMTSDIIYRGFSHYKGSSLH